MGAIEWGAEPEFFGPRHAHREARIVRLLRQSRTTVGLHLECAAGVGSLTVTLARLGHTTVAADSSLQSLKVVRRRAAAGGVDARVMVVVADIMALPFRDATFASASTAETLEHVPDHGAAARELARALEPGGCLVGTVPAGPGQWSDWDVWAGHLRRYSRDAMEQLLRGAGLEPQVTVWGWPLLRIYDDLFLRRITRRRLKGHGPLESDPTLRAVSGLGKRRWLVKAVQLVFGLDRLCDGMPWGVGLLFRGLRPAKETSPGRPAS